MSTAHSRPLADLLRPDAENATDMQGLTNALFAAVGQRIPYDFACFAATDPATGVITWVSKTRPLSGVEDKEWAAAEYGRPDINTFTAIARRTPPVGVLSIDTNGRLADCLRHRDFLAPRFGFTDELRAAFVSRGATWGAVAMYRGQGEPPFIAADGQQLATVTEMMAVAIQHKLFRTGSASAVTTGEGPAVLILDADDRVTQLTPVAEDTITELGGWNDGALPEIMLAAVAATRRSGGHTDTRVRSGRDRWLSLRAAPLSGPADRHDLVVTIEPTPRAALSRLALAAHGLTAREEDVALLVLQGADTRAIARSLHLSPHTVQDHLKRIFTKFGVTSRRDLTARLAID